MDIEERIELTFTKLGLREPFIAAVMTKVKRVIDEAIPTAGTNGSVVKYNPVWCMQWSDEELFGLTLHEALHVVLMHMWRREGRDPGLWNYANDAVINAYILARGYQLPPGGVHVSWVKEADDSEAVYEKMRQEQNKQQQSQSGQGKSDPNGQPDPNTPPGAGQPGKGKPDPNGRPDPNAPKKGGWDNLGDLEDAVNEAARADMEATIIVAAQMAKECGHGSSIVDRILGQVGTSQVRWQDETRAMVTSAMASDFTYSRFSRRFIGSGLYLPSLHSPALGGLAIGFDTSGSMGPKEANQIGCEIQQIVDDLQPEFVEVIYCDTKVTRVQRFDRGETIELKPSGGGGTRFQPVFAHLDKTGDNYCGMIFFTDMEGNLSECREPSFPVIWADIGRSHPDVPFGTRVEVKL